jgi:hypothetical protein
MVDRAIKVGRSAEYLWYFIGESLANYLGKVVSNGRMA